MKRRGKWLTLFNLVTTMLSWAFMSLLFVIFYTGCMNPSHKLLIEVNRYGEMWLEVILFGFIWCLTTINVIRLWRRLVGESRRSSKL